MESSKIKKNNKACKENVLDTKQTTISFEENEDEEKQMLKKKRKIPYPRNLIEKKIKVSETMICRLLINDLGSFIDFRYIDPKGEYTRKGLRLRIQDFNNILPTIQDEIEALNKLKLIK